MRSARRDQESISWAQYYGGTSLDPHLDLASDDVADLFSWMNVPSGLDSRRNQRLHLHHLTTWNRQRRALDLAPRKLTRQVVPSSLIGLSRCGGACTRPLRLALQAQAARKRSVSYGASFKYVSVEPC